MRFTRIISIVFVFGLIVPLLVSGIDPTTSGRILDAFKDEEYSILFENSPFDESDMNDIYEKEYMMAGIKWLKSRLDDVVKQYEEKKAHMVSQRITLEEAIIMIENSITDTAADIRNIEMRMREKNLEIEEYKDLSIDLSRRIKKNREILLSYVANIYTESNLIFNDSNQVDILQSLIITDTSTDTVGRDIMYKSLVSILGQQFIDDYRNLIKEYYRITNRIEEEIASLDREQVKLDKKKNDLMTQRKYREDLVSATKGKEELYTKYINAQIETQKQLENSWQDANKEYNVSLEKLLEKNGCTKKEKTGQDIEKCANILTFYRNEKALKKVSFSTGTSNIMTWPIDTIKSISSYYKDADYYYAVWSQHDAIDIPVEQWSDVRASLGWYIYYILPPVYWWYSYMAIKHPNGYFSVYGHLSEVLVKPYQFVEQGQIIAKSGWAPGTPWAWPMTTWPHLHFEVFKDRESIDPLRVLDVSRLDYSILPSRYQDKFISDIVAKFGSGVDTSGYDRRFIIHGTTEEERQKYLLETYAAPDFQNWDIWVDTALEARIDPSFLMCVGLAETTLGNYLKTRYNVWNVGNTDSGDVVYFSSPTEGIAWMASTFNNRFLSKYTYVSELSRWWNDNGTIYASSNANWHNNIIKCVSSLKGRFVEDKYNFRAKNILE
jgi:murein DD-endopeptidase MepM/ murein hydrolase activator NlpD